MGVPEHIRQQQYRRRRAARLERAVAMERALERVLAVLEGNDKPLAVSIKEIAMEGLGR